jgi:hypothetical protein
MFAKVKKVIKNPEVNSGGHSNCFVMHNFCGKKIPVVHKKGTRGWFTDTLRSGGGFSWHRSWLVFAAKNAKVGRKTSYNKRIKRGLKPHAKRTS